MRTVTSPWTLASVVVVGFIAFTASGCTSSGYGWQNLAWWKKGPAPNSIASRPGPTYPTPPSTNFPPRPTSTAAASSPYGSYGQDYSNSGGPSNSPSSYPTTNTPYGAGSYNGGASYMSGQGEGGYDSGSSPYSNNSYGAQKGYYSVDPPAGTSSGHSPYSGYNSSGSGGDYRDYGGSDLRGPAATSGDSYQGSNLRSSPSPGASTYPYGPSGSSHEQSPWNDNSSSSAPWQGSSSAPDQPTPYGQSSNPSSSTPPWQSDASRSSFTQHDQSSDAYHGSSERGTAAPSSPDQYASADRTHPSLGSDHREAPMHQLPDALVSRRGGYSPGSIGRGPASRTANANSFSSQQASRSNSSQRYGDVRRVDYEQDHDDDQLPSPSPPPSSSFPSGSYSFGSSTR